MQAYAFPSFPKHYAELQIYPIFVFKMLKLYLPSGTSRREEILHLDKGSLQETVIHFISIGKGILKDSTSAPMPLQNLLDTLQG